MSLDLNRAHEQRNGRHEQMLLDELRGAGYSCITSIDKNHIGVLYEGSQCNMVFQVINIKEFM